jgi:hypothetical protein
VDWERTKTVLILAFLLLDIFFVCQLWLVPTFFDSTMYISAEQIDTKLTELQYKNIKVSAEIPRRMQSLRILSLRSPGLDWEVVARRILGYGMATVPIPPNSHPVVRRYLSAKGEVIVRSDGSMLYSSELESSGGVLTAEEAVAKAEEFLQVTVGRPEGATPDRIEKMGDGTYLVEFSQRWRRRKIETSWIWVTVDAEGILGMEYYWADVVGYSGEKIATIPATGALTTIADALPQGSTITKLYCSWYSKPVSAQQWRAYPAWVIEISDGTRYYINAFTGDLEGTRNFRQENPNKS